jgi:hypothetical protein
VLNFGRWFKRAAGRAESLTAEASRRGRHWLHGLSHSRAAFCLTPTRSSLLPLLLHCSG